MSQTCASSAYKPSVTLLVFNYLYIVWVFRKKNNQPQARTACSRRLRLWVLASVWQCVPLRRPRLSRLCTHSPAGAAGPSHLRPVCRASSNLAASGGATGAFSVSSPQDCHESSVKSSRRLSCRPPRKLTRPGGGRGDAGGDVFFFLCVCLCCDGVTVSPKSLCQGLTHN